MRFCFRFGFACVAALAFGAFLGCGRSPRPLGSEANAASSAETADASVPLEADLWARATDGDTADLARLVDRLGCDSLMDKAGEGGRGPRGMVAIRAVAYCTDWTPLPWLAHIARTADDRTALAALDSLVALAAVPRQQVHRESPEEEQTACADLLAIAKNTRGAKDKRILAINALRMFSEDPFFAPACVSRADIPADLDSK